MHVRIQRGTGSPDPPPPSKIFSNTGPNPLKIEELPSQLSILDHNRHASDAFLWRAENGPLIVVFG